MYISLICTLNTTFRDEAPLRMNASLSQKQITDVRQRIVHTSRCSQGELQLYRRRFPELSSFGHVTFAVVISPDFFHMCRLLFDGVRSWYGWAFSKWFYMHLRKICGGQICWNLQESVGMCRMCPQTDCGIESHNFALRASTFSVCLLVVFLTQKLLWKFELFLCGMDFKLYPSISRKLKELEMPKRTNRAGDMGKFLPRK